MGLEKLNYARLLTEGVGAWLHFESACGRSGLFSEKYLAHPIGQILSAQSGNRALAEYRHPILAPLAQGAGRRPEVDFVVCEPYPKITLAVESKWIGKTTPTVQSIIWDLIRLELLAYHEKARCFFILGGKKVDLEKLFKLEAFADEKGKTHRKPLLRRDSNFLHKTDLAPVVKVRIPLLKNLFSSFQSFGFPSEIISRRSEPFPKDTKMSHYQVYCWEIVAPEGKRDIFYPQNSAHYVAPIQKTKKETEDES